MTSTVSIIGFGEAGQTFAAAGKWEERARVYDVKTSIAAQSSAKYLDYANHRVSGSTSMQAAVSDCDVVISLVTADQALDAAAAAAPCLSPGTLYLDMNSVAPATKTAAAEIIEKYSGHYLDVALMAPVQPKALAVPLLLAGAQGKRGLEDLAALGFSNIRCVGEDVGTAAAIKMIRSVMVKGMEALAAECCFAADAAGVLDEVARSLGSGWIDQTNYKLDRMMVHGLRRAAEMEESAKTLAALGTPFAMTEATVAWQRKIGTLSHGDLNETLRGKLSQLAERLKQ